MATLKSHTDQINSIDFCNKNGRIYVLVASSDCSVSLNDVKGNLIGQFGQEVHWKLEPAIPSVMSRATPGNTKFYSGSFTASLTGGPRATLPTIEVSTTQMDQLGRGKFGSIYDEMKSSSFDMTLDEELRKQIEAEFGKNCHLPRLKKQLSVDETFDFENDAFVNNTGLRYNPWTKTILGKTMKL